MIIISLSGHIGSGKSYIANKIREYAQNMGYNTIILSFAAIIKRFVYETTNTLKNGDKIIKRTENKNIANMIYPLLKRETKELLEIIKTTNDENKGEIKMLLRKIYQKIGEDVREHNEDFFVNYVINIIKKLPQEIDIVVIDDLRFKNEYKLLRKEFGKKYIAIYLERDIYEIIEQLGISKEQYMLSLQHISETELEEVKNLCDIRLINSKYTNINEKISILLWGLFNNEILQ